MSEPARVLWLAKGLGRGGAERLLVTAAAHIDPSRFSVDVAYLLPWKDAFVPELRERGLHVHCLHQSGPTDLRWASRLRRLMATQRYDVVHTHMPVPAVAARLLAGSSAKLVHSEHNVWSRYRRPTYVANALTYRRNDAVIAVSQAVRDSIPGRYLPRPPATTEVLLHGIEPEAARTGTAARAEARRALGLAEDAFVVGTVGNFTPKKDQRTLITAVAGLRRTHPEAVLVLVGTGPLDDELREQARRELGNAALFTGSRSDVLELLPALDVFALSSLHEGLSIALVEALSSGVPAVCTAVGGVPEVLTHEREGLLVPAARATALEDALRRMAADGALRERFAAAALVRARAFDISAAVRRIESIYDEVLAR